MGGAQWRYTWCRPDPTTPHAREVFAWVPQGPCQRSLTHKHHRTCTPLPPPHHPPPPERTRGHGVGPPGERLHRLGALVVPHIHRRARRRKLLPLPVVVDPPEGVAPAKLQHRLLVLLDRAAVEGRKRYLLVHAGAGGDCVCVVGYVWDCVCVGACGGEGRLMCTPGVRRHPPRQVLGRGAQWAFVGGKPRNFGAGESTASLDSSLNF